MFKKPVLHLILISNALLNVHLASANDAQTVTEVISETQCSFAV